MTFKLSMKKRTDFLVIGSGIAGLTFALKAAKYGKVTVVTKANLEERIHDMPREELLQYSANLIILRNI